MAKKEKLKIIPLGGIGEIGKNITVLEYGNDIVVVDCGMAFPDEELPGVDLVLPDLGYLIKNKEKVRALALTHGHEDHIGALPFLLRDINMPIYATKLTIGLVKRKLEEHPRIKKPKLNVVKAGDKIKAGVFEFEPICVNHSIPDAVAYAIKTPVGTVIFTGDFKIDTTPIMGDIIDVARFGELGREGVLALCCDSTNVERPGLAMSERKVGLALEKLFMNFNKQRILIATFASNVHRVQQIINVAVAHGRKVAVSGRSMENVMEVSRRLGYLNIPEGEIIPLDTIKRYPPEKLVIITTGSQGEPMSALSRIAFSDHKKIEIMPGDCVCLSALPIPGNEKLVNRVINELVRLGAEVVSENEYDVHVSGHACQEEIKLMINLVKPKFFIPVHGEHRHLYASMKLAKTLGYTSKNILLTDIGRVLELDQKTAKFNGNVPSGRVFVDGLGVGDVGNIVLRDRMHLSQDGLIVIVAAFDSEGRIVSGPDVVSRGFVYVRENEELMDKICAVAAKAFEQCAEKKSGDWATKKNKVRGAVSELIYEKTKRKPMILPVIMEV